MINSFRYIIFFAVINLISFQNVPANEQFKFDVTEIEILDNGNQINGYKGGVATTEDGNKIIADTFLYNKITNILEARGKVKFIDVVENVTITSDKATYFKNNEQLFTEGNSKAVSINNTITGSNFEYDKIRNIIKAKGNVDILDKEKNTTLNSDEITYLKNDEKIFTKGKTTALVENKYNFVSEDIIYLRKKSIFSSIKKSSLRDHNDNFYQLDNFQYSIDKKLLKGKKVKILSKIGSDISGDTKTDEYFFSEGFFNLEKKSFLSKETNIKVHKDIFGNSENDPRLIGSSSKGNEAKIIVNNGIFTSCKINDNCPPWSIKSEQIIHDKVKKNLIYKNAFLQIYDVPILYFPKFFHPDPTVKRRSGFLQPQFNNSQTLGSSLYTPYFKTLGDDMDLTFKPTFFETKSDNKKYILQNEFRKENKDSSLIADFALIKSYKSSSDNKKKNINHFFLNYDKDLKLPNFLESKIDAKIERVSNDTYLKVFRQNLFDTPILPGNSSTMTSNINLSLDHEDYNLTTGIVAYENLGTKHSDRYQFVFPYYNFDKSFIIDKFDGSFTFSSSGNNNLSNTNNLKTTVANDAQYSSAEYFTKNGLKNNFDVYFKNLNSIGKNDPIYTSTPQIDAMNIIRMNSEFPLFKYNSSSTETLTPKISFRLNPGNNMDDYRSSSSIINANNVFDINRLGLSDSYEAGKSLTIGVNYKFEKFENDIDNDENIKDKYLDFKLATVFRDQNEIDIPVSSTINEKNSDIFGSINNNLFENINLGYDFSLDSDLKTINSNTINAEIEINNFITTFDFIEQRNEIGSTHAISASLEYLVDKNTTLKFDTRRNKEINLTEYYNLSYEYKNDCLTAALEFNKTFYSDNDLNPTEDLFFSITLIPLTTYEKEIYKRK